MKARRVAVDESELITGAIGVFWSDIAEAMGWLTTFHDDLSAKSWLAPVIDSGVFNGLKIRKRRHRG